MVQARVSADRLKMQYGFQITSSDLASLLRNDLILNTILIISGLFAKKSFDKGTFISFYNGIRMSVDDLDDNRKQVSC